MLPHSGQPVAQAGAPRETATVAMVMVHGRNAAPRNILDLLPRIDRPEVACLAPAAAGGTWYPLSFLSERERNEPGLSSGLDVLERLVAGLIDAGRPVSSVILLGFSQGACLTAEYAFRHPRRYGGVAVLSGGLIGPPGTTWGEPPGDLAGTPVFLGCSDVDGHVPAERVLESEVVFQRMGARVTRTLYPGMGHLVNDDEIRHVQAMIDAAIANHDSGGRHVA